MHASFVSIHNGNGSVVIQICFVHRDQLEVIPACVYPGNAIIVYDIAGAYLLRILSWNMYS